MIAVENLHVTFNPGTPLERKALRGVSITLNDGEFVTVIGSNGAGKSTLLGAIAGDATPQKGVIRVGSDDVTREKPSSRARRVARVFQDPLAGSCADLSIEENLALASMRGSPRGFRSALQASRRALLQFIFFQYTKHLFFYCNQLLDRLIIDTTCHFQTVCFLKFF